MTGLEVIVAVVILVGLAGVVVPLLPASLLILGAVLVWAVDIATVTGWVVFTIAAGLLGGGQIAKYTVPARRLQAGEVPRSTVVLGGLLGIVGFFVVPVVGLFLGFVLGIYLAELRRVGARRARASTRAALGAVGISVLIELAAGLLAAAAWIAGVAIT